MTRPLPRIRLNLEIMPSPIEDRPGLLIRDPLRYSDVTAVIPPPILPCLQCFDGEKTEADLKALLVRITGNADVDELARHLVESLSESGFLIDDRYAALRDESHGAFARAATRTAVHAGAAYPGDAAELTSVLDGYLAGGNGSAEPLIGIAAPHVSPHGGARSYAAAYGALDPSLRDRTFVILGTSHYGEPERFGITRKPFETPYGRTVTDAALAERLIREGGAAVSAEDYCHSIEHSIEFQVIFLQKLYGPDVKILPILCGPLVESLYEGGPPEADDGVKRFFGALGDMAAREAGRLIWVLGIDMAHMGRRYGDGFTARADRDEMAQVAGRDRDRIDRVNAGDAAGFWALVQENRDDLKWCGSSPLYTFLKAVPAARGSLLNYEQWNIDEESVVTFAGMAFTSR